MVDQNRLFWQSFAEQVTQLQQLWPTVPEKSASLKQCQEILTELSMALQNYQQDAHMAEQWQKWVTEIYRLLRLVALDVQFTQAARQPDRQRQRLEMMGDRLQQLSTYTQQILERL